MTMDDVIAMLLDKAPRLRTAGVLELVIGDLRVVLAPVVERHAEPVAVTAIVDETLDAAHDPLTYGLPPGSKVPGFERDPQPPRQEDE